MYTYSHAVRYKRSRRLIIKQPTNNILLKNKTNETNNIFTYKISQTEKAIRVCHVSTDHRRHSPRPTTIRFYSEARQSERVKKTERCLEMAGRVRPSINTFHRVAIPGCARGSRRGDVKWDKEEEKQTGLSTAN